MKKLFITLLLFVTSFYASAHALWIETNGQGTVGKQHDIKILYGELGEGLFEPVDKWYSDVNTFKLWLISPTGEKTQLQLTSASDHYLATFVPKSEGIYLVSTAHSAKEIDGGYIYQFNASASVSVGKSSDVLKVLPENELFIQAVSGKGNEGVVKAFFKGKPAGEIEISVSGPTGWSKRFKTDANGVLHFETLWSGAYAIEGFYTTEEAGTHFEKAYDHIWRCATTKVILTKK